MSSVQIVVSCKNLVSTMLCTSMWRLWCFWGPSIVSLWFFIQFFVGGSQIIKAWVLLLDLILSCHLVFLPAEYCLKIVVALISWRWQWTMGPDKVSTNFWKQPVMTRTQSFIMSSCKTTRYWACLQSRLEVNCCIKLVLLLELSVLFSLFFFLSSYSKSANGISCSLMGLFCIRSLGCF